MEASQHHITQVDSFNLTCACVNVRRPYNSEQEIPTLEELVGVSELNCLAISCVQGDEASTELGGLLKSLDPLTHAIAIEEENERMIRAYLKSPRTRNLDLVTDYFSPLDCGISNVLLSRAERHRCTTLPRSPLETDNDHVVQWGGDGRTTQSQGPEQPEVDNPSEVSPLPFTPKLNLMSFRITTMRAMSGRIH
jgi:hypothetical protein